MKSPNIIIFDTHCLLCNKSVQFIIKHDPQALFSFTSMNSLLAEKLRQQYQLHNLNNDTIVLIKNNKSYLRSDAVLEILGSFGAFWKLFYLAKICPRFIRDFIYNLLAKHRYKWFGRSPDCRLSTPEEKNRYMDDISEKFVP